MYRVGFDIGGTNIAAGIVDDSHAIIARKTWPFKKEAYPGELAETVAEMTHALCRAAGLQKTPASLGIAVPGSIDPEAEHVLDAYNLGLHNVPPRLHDKALLFRFGRAVSAGGKRKHLVVWPHDNTVI